MRTQHAFSFIKVTNSYNLSVIDAALLTQIIKSCVQPFSASKYFYLMSPLPPPSFSESLLLITVTAENKKDGLFLFFLPPFFFFYLKMASLSLLFSRLKSSNPFSLVNFLGVLIILSPISLTVIYVTLLNIDNAAVISFQRMILPQCLLVSFIVG